MQPKSLRWIGLVAVLVCSFWTLWTTTKPAYEAAPANSIRYEWSETHSDAPNIIAGVREKSFLETFSFWAGPWALVGFDFYRPIPSVAWWAMYHSFGENSLGWFLGVLAVSHVIATLVLWRFLCYLLRSEVSGTMATCAFALGLAYLLFKLATPAYALEMWIDLVEPWLLIPYVLTCWTFLKYLREGGRWLPASLACFGITICVKEAAYTLPLTALALLWYEQKLGRWRALLPFVAVAIAGLVFRTWVLGGTGTRFGSNGSWLQRAVIEMGGGYPAVLLIGREFLPFAVVFVFGSLLLFALGRRRAAAAMAAAATAAIVACTISYRWMEDPFYYVLLGGTAVWYSAVMVALWLACGYRLITNPTRGQLFGLFWVVATYSVLLASTTTLHTLYLPAVGFALVIGGFIEGAVDRLRIGAERGTASSWKVSEETEHFAK